MDYRLITNQSGVAAVTVLMILMATVLISMGALMIASTDIKVAGNYRDTAAAFYAAEAGVEHTIARLKGDREWTDGLNDVSLPNGVEYDTTVETLTHPYHRKITSVAKAGESYRKLEVIVDVDSVYDHALNAGGDAILIGKPRISPEGIRVNGGIYMDMDAGVTGVNVYLPETTNATIEGVGADGVTVGQKDPMDWISARLSDSQWKQLADMAPPSHYFDIDGVFDSKDTEVTLHNFDCAEIPADENGHRTIFIDGDVHFSGHIYGTCSIISTGTIKAEGNFVACSCAIWSMVAKGDVMLNFDTNYTSPMHGLVYAEGDYELHGKVKFTGTVSVMGNINIQNPSEFTNNSDSDYWFTYSAAYNILSDPIDIISWYEKPNTTGS
jgi:hypothetical protein